jgi:glutathione S-transferase
MNTNSGIVPIKLYFSPATRSTRPRWLLEELGVPYELVVVDMKARAHKEPDYLARIHPHGAVPAAEIDGKHIIESGAIVATLADRFPEKALAPHPQSAERANYFQWLFYAQATVEPAIVSMLETRKEGATHTAEKKESIESHWREVLSFLDKNLDKKDWITGQRFCAADCVMGSLLVWANSTKIVENAPNVVAYVERCKSRPAFQKARKLPE